MALVYVGSLFILHDAHEQWDALELCSASGSWRPRLPAIYLDPGPAESRAA